MRAANNAIDFAPEANMRGRPAAAPSLFDARRIIRSRKSYRKHSRKRLARECAQAGAVGRNPADRRPSHGEAAFVDNTIVVAELSEIKPCQPNRHDQLRGRSVNNNRTR